MATMIRDLKDMSLWDFLLIWTLVKLIQVLRPVIIVVTWPFRKTGLIQSRGPRISP